MGPMGLAILFQIAHQYANKSKKWNFFRFLHTCTPNFWKSDWSMIRNWKKKKGKSNNGLHPLIRIQFWNGSEGRNYSRDICMWIYRDPSHSAVSPHNPQFEAQTFLRSILIHKVLSRNPRAGHCVLVTRPESCYLHVILVWAIHPSA